MWTIFQGLVLESCVIICSRDFRFIQFTKRTHTSTCLNIVLLWHQKQIGFKIGRINKLSIATEFSNEKFLEPTSTNQGDNAKELTTIAQISQVPSSSLPPVSLLFKNLLDVHKASLSLSFEILIEHLGFLEFLNEARRLRTLSCL